MYRTICTQLWTDKKVQRLTVQGKLLFVYLITNPHTHLSGIYYLPQELMRKETGLSDTLCHTLLDTLSKEERAHYDQETSTVFVVNMFEYQGKGPKNEKSAAKQLETLHHTRLIALFLERYPGVKPFCSDTLSIPYRYPIPSCPSVPVPVLLTSSAPKTNLKSNGYTNEFEQFWRAYPKRIGKKKAYSAWKKATDRPEMAQVIRRIEESKRTEQWMKENGQFIPHPSTWINEGRWDDEPMLSNGKTQRPPPPPPKTDPIGRGLWGRTYGDPKSHGYD